MTRHLTLLFTLLGTASLAACGDDPTQATLKDPSACVPLEQRTDCSLHDGDRSLTLKNQQDINRVCRSECRKVSNLRAGDDIADLSVLRLVEIEQDADILIDRAFELTSLKGLESVQSTRILRLRNIPNLQSLEPLSSLHEASKIEIEQTGINDLSGLGSIERINSGSESIILRHNSNLSSLHGLNSLEEVYSLQIDDNDALKDLDGLKSLETVERGLAISDNDALQSLEGLSNVTKSPGLRIDRNASLPSCLVEQFAQRVEHKEIDAIIELNGPDSPDVCD